MGHVTDTYNAAYLAILMQVDGRMDTDPISAHEAARRIDRADILAQCARLGIRVVSLESADLSKWARRLGLEL